MESNLIRKLKGGQNYYISTFFAAPSYGPLLMEDLMFSHYSFQLN